MPRKRSNKTKRCQVNMNSTNSDKTAKIEKRQAGEQVAPHKNDCTSVMITNERKETGSERQTHSPTTEISHPALQPGNEEQKTVLCPEKNMMAFHSTENSQKQQAVADLGVGESSQKGKTSVELRVSEGSRKEAKKQAIPEEVMRSLQKQLEATQLSLQQMTQKQKPRHHSKPRPALDILSTSLSNFRHGLLTPPTTPPLMYGNLNPFPFRQRLPCPDTRYYSGNWKRWRGDRFLSKESISRHRSFSGSDPGNLHGLDGSFPSVKPFPEDSGHIMHRSATAPDFFKHEFNLMNRPSENDAHQYSSSNRFPFSKDFTGFQHSGMCTPRSLSIESDYVDGVINGDRFQEKVSDAIPNHDAYNDHFPTIAEAMRRSSEPLISFPELFEVCPSTIDPKDKSPKDPGSHTPVSIFKRHSDLTDNYGPAEKCARRQDSQDAAISDPLQFYPSNRNTHKPCGLTPAKQIHENDDLGQHFRARSMDSGPSAASRTKAFPLQDLELLQSELGAGEDTPGVGLTLFKSPPLSLYCSKCRLYYRWPHLLDCFHVFCFPCMITMNDSENKQIKCPTCSRSHLTEDRPHLGLKLDFQYCLFLLNAMIVPFCCTSCMTQKTAAMYCNECLKYLCSDCLIHHETQPGLASHELDRVKSVAQVNAKWVQTCVDHAGEQIDKFCADCRTPICLQCRATEGQHKEHIISSLESRYHNAVSSITSKTRHLARVHEMLLNKMQMLNAKKQSNENDARSIVRAIHKYSNDTLALIDENKQQARLAVDNLFDCIGKELDTQEATALVYAKEHKAFTTISQRYLIEGVAEDVLHMMPHLERAYATLCEEYLKLQQTKSLMKVDVQFSPDYPRINEFMNSTFSDIVNEEEADSDPRAFRRSFEPSNAHTREIPGVSTEATSKENGLWNESESCSDSDAFNYPRRTVSAFETLGRYGRGPYEFSEPTGIIFLNDGGFAVCDSKNHRVLVYNEQREHVRTIGQPPDTGHLENPKRIVSRTAGYMYFPYRMAQCSRSNNIVIIERPPSRDIQVFSLEGKFIARFGTGVVQYPRAVTVDEHRQIIVAEGRSMILLIFSQNYKLSWKHHLSAYLQFPTDLAVRNGIIYICDNRSNCVHKFDYKGDYFGKIGNESVTYYPIGVAINYQDQIVVTDNHNTFNISIFDLDGRYVLGFKSRVKHDNCYNVALHPKRMELAVTSKNYQVIFFNYEANEDIATFREN